MKTKHIILLTDEQEPVTEDDLRRRERYKNDPAFKEQADHIHESRMLALPCCDDCMRLAELQMKKPVEWWVE